MTQWGKPTPSKPRSVRSACDVAWTAAAVLSLGLMAACTAPPPGTSSTAPTTADAIDAAPSAASSSTTDRPPDVAVSAPASPTAQELQWDRSVVRIRVVSCAGVGTGSGFLVDPTTIITARHVVEGASTIEVETWDGTDLAVAEAQEAQLVDLGIIRLATPVDIAPLAVALADPHQGGDVVAIGYPEGNQLKSTDGEVLGYFNDVQYGSLGRIMRFTSPIKPGNSGGPLLSAEGDVVGVVYAIDLDNEDSLAVPAASIMRLLDGAFEPTTVAAC